MASILIVKKMTTPGKKNLPIRARYHVRWERGRGRATVHLGVFDTETLAKRRVRSAFDQLARGEVPTADPLAGDPTPAEPMRIVGPRWLERRLKIADGTRASHSNSIVHINKRFGDDDPHAITVDEIQEWIASMSAAGAKPGSIRNRLTTLRLILRHAKVKPNPAADEEIELPPIVREEFNLPTRRELDLLEAALAEKYRPLLRMLEHAGLRISEAVALDHSDIDEKMGVRVRKGKTSAARRWVWQIDGLPVLPERGVGRVYPGVTSDGMQSAMRRACVKAGIPNYSPHDLRHLAISRWMRTMDDAIVAKRAGHSSSNITHQKYAHAILPNHDAR